MQRDIELLQQLGQGQMVRLQFTDGTSLEARVNQMEFSPEERIRIELTTDDDGDESRYQIRSHMDEGAWTPIQVRRYDRLDDAWQSLTAVDEIVPLEMFRTMKSNDMEAQEDTGTVR